MNYNPFPSPAELANYRYQTELAQNGGTPTFLPMQFEQEQPQFVQPQQQMQPRGAAFWMAQMKDAFQNALAMRQGGKKKPSGVPGHGTDVQTPPIMGVDSRVQPANTPVQPIRPRFGALPYGGYTNA